MDSKDKAIPVIICGGSGTRLWPLSRRLSPKQFIHLPDGETLFSKTLRRATNIGLAPGVIVGSQTHKFTMRKLTAESAQDDWVAIHEPSSQNTAAAIALAAMYAVECMDSRPLLVLPADHLIEDHQALAERVAVATQCAHAGHLATFGVRPDRIETGYGHIQTGDGVEGMGEGVFHVKQFKEKPDEKTARGMAESGGWLWNSGMFVLPPARYLECLKERAPEIDAAVSRACEIRDGEVVVDAEAFAECPDVSIDYAVMEKSSDVVVVASDFDWNDIGSWSAFSKLMTSDERGNRLSGDVVAEDCRDTTTVAGKRLVALVGLKNTLVVETADAVLVADADRTQDVRDVVQTLKAQERDEADTPRTVHRPWGSYTNIDIDKNFQVKRIVVDPGQTLSLQRHRRRSEHWVVVQGKVRVTCDDKEFDLRANESTYIPIMSKHRLENPTDEPAYLIEVQCGDYLGEDDIERFDDRYGRTTKD